MKRHKSKLSKHQKNMRWFAVFFGVLLVLLLAAVMWLANTMRFE
jgi:uncharacterized integral membrane protein